MDELQTTAREALQRATDFSFSCQQPDGHWVAPVSSDAGFTAQYVMFRYAIPGLTIGDDDGEIKRWLLADQDPVVGSWSLAPGLEGDLSVSIEAYLALRLLGTPASEHSMQLARDFIVSKGGIAKVRFLTRVFLAVFDLIPWDAMPQIPVELMLMPAWAPLNIYAVASWARSTLVPILILFHHRPVYPLPQDSDRYGSKYLDELWINPSNKHVSCANLSDAFYGCDPLKAVFILGDKMIAGLGGLQKGPQRRLAIQRCIAWIMEHQEPTGGTAGFLAPVFFGIWALHLEGHSIHDDYIRRGLEAMERLLITDAKGKWIQTTDSPVWDTALMVKGLCDAGVGKQDPRITSAIQWLKDRQLSGPEGDWRIYSPNKQSGGWSFEYNNNWYPDVDDTAAIIIMLVDHDTSSVTSETVAAAANWVLGMQNYDGGWAAFDTNNDAQWFRSVPFNDMDNFSDPSSADITARVVECFGILLRTRVKGQGIDEALSRRLRLAAEKGIRYLLKHQESGGSWYGRWACNHVYGTSNVIRGLAEFCTQGEPKNIHRAISRGLRWIETHQNNDGGWGEEYLSYFDDANHGIGQSTAAQTAWALDSLLRYRSTSNEAVMAGVRWLVTNQNTDEKTRTDYSSWPSDKYVAVGFPDGVLLGYPFFHHHFAMSVLGRFLSSCKHETLFENGHSDAVYVPPARVISTLSRPDILLMEPGSRSDVDIILRIAMKLQQKGCRTRIIAHPSHRHIIEKHGSEFYSMSDRFTEPEFTAAPGRGVTMLLRSILGSGFHRLRHSLFRGMMALWLAGFSCNRHSVDEKSHDRPFVADAIISMSAAMVHVHAAEALQVPIVLVSAQPNVAADEFPRPFAVGRYKAGLLGYSLCLFFFRILNWLAHMSFASRLRTQDSLTHYSSVWPFRAYPRGGIPHIVVHRAQSDNDGSSIAADMVESQLAMNRQDKSRCAVLPSIEAQWRHVGLDTCLSGAVAASLVESGNLCWDDLISCPWKEWDTEHQPSFISSVFHLLCRILRVITLIPVLASVLSMIRPGGHHERRNTESSITIARIQKSNSDLEFIIRNADSDAGDLDERFADFWGGMVACKRQEEFSR